MLDSNFVPLAYVKLPNPKAGRQFYMHTINLAKPTVPEGFEDYLKPVTSLLDIAGADEGIAYLTVDEKVVKAGMSQRRPKPHVDGCFIPKVELKRKNPFPSLEELINTVPVGSWAHNNLLEQLKQEQENPSGHWGHGGGGGGGWLHTCNNIRLSVPKRMPVIVAASPSGCRAWRGKFVGEPKSDGDLSHISNQLERGQVLPANLGFLLSADCVHESMVFEKDTPRTFIRIALPNDVDYGV